MDNMLPLGIVAALVMFALAAISRILFNDMRKLKNRANSLQQNILDLCRVIDSHDKKIKENSNAHNYVSNIFDVLQEILLQHNTAGLAMATTIQALHQQMVPVRFQDLEVGDVFRGLKLPHEYTVTEKPNTKECFIKTQCPEEEDVHQEWPKQELIVFRVKTKENELLKQMILLLNHMKENPPQEDNETCGHCECADCKTDQE